MAAIITQPEFSFIRFAPDHQPISRIESRFNLPVVNDDDIAFQFIVDTDTETEADQLCDIGNTRVRVGITQNNNPAWLIDFTTALQQRPERYRIGPRRLLYNWPHGLTGFADVIDIEQCFQIAVAVNIGGIDSFGYSNKLERIPDDLYTAVLEFGSSRNTFGFFYCGYFEDETIPDSTLTECTATTIPFSGQSVVPVNYTPAMREAYGDLPTVEVYHYNSETGYFDKTIVAVSMDAVPPTIITVDNGGPANGYIKIY